MARESSLYAALRQTKAAYVLKISDRVRPGVPDYLWLRYSDLACGWLELKTETGLSRDQRAFLDVWVHHGGRAGVLEKRRRVVTLTDWRTKRDHLLGKNWPDELFSLL